MQATGLQVCQESIDGSFRRRFVQHRNVADIGHGHGNHAGMFTLHADEGIGRTGAAQRGPFEPRRGLESSPSEAHSMPRILIVDDEVNIRRLLSGVLGDEGFATEDAGSAEQALESLRTRPGAHDAVLLDLALPGIARR